MGVSTAGAVANGRFEPRGCAMLSDQNLPKVDQLLAAKCQPKKILGSKLGLSTKPQLARNHGKA